MTLTLRIDRLRWETHQRTLLDSVPGLVPVAKGNGYGFGLGLLAQQATQLGVDTIAVGIAEEVPQVRAGGFVGDIVVLNPWRPFDEAATALLHDQRVISTLSRVEDVATLATRHPGARIIVELETSMHRHGLAASSLTASDFDSLDLAGWAVHLPATGSLEEARSLAASARSIKKAPLWFSHLSVPDYQSLDTELGTDTRMRVGTRLWLGNKSAYSTLSSVLDVHRIEKGARLGYHQVRAPKDGFIVIASGGTANGVAMAAPVPQRSLRQRGVTVAQGILDAAGRTLSPFEIGGKKRTFAEPPHMHSSMVFYAGDVCPVQVGDEIPVTTRMTTVTVDEIRYT